MQITIPAGCNVFSRVKNHELYLGVDLYRLRIDNARSVGLETGYKFHFKEKKRENHFYAEFNFQHSKWTAGCSYNLNYFYNSELEYDCSTMKRNKTYLFGLMVGYEKFVARRLSFTLATGPGLNYFYSKPTEYWSNHFWNQTQKIYIFYWGVKGSVRLHIIKKASIIEK